MNWLVSRKGLLLEIGLVLAITLIVAAPLRLLFFDSIPQGLNVDEAAEAVDALAIGQDGYWPAFLPANNGREPLFAYAVAGMFGIFGASAGTLRLTAALLGLLAVPATYLMVREMFGRRTALLAASLMAMSGWALHLSRFAVRPVAMTFLAALSAYFLWRMVRTGRLWSAVACGICLGLAMYTYMPARALPLILLALPVALLVSKSPEFKSAGRRLVALCASAVIVAAVVALPLVLYFFGHPQEFSGRAGQVSVINEINAGADPVSVLSSNVGKTLGMFFVQGDTNPRHNLPGRPVFDIPLAVFAVAGLLVALRRIRRPACLVLLWWIVVMLVPAALSDSAPHYLRSVGLLPAVLVLPAIGLNRLWEWSRQLNWRPALARGRELGRPLTGVVLGLVLLSALALSIRDVFFLWADDPQTALAFDAPKVEAGRYLVEHPSGAQAFVGPLEASDTVIGFLWPGLQYQSFGWSSLPLATLGQAARYVVVGADENVLRLLRTLLPDGRESAAGDQANNRLYELKPSAALAGWPATLQPHGAVFNGEIEWLGYQVLEAARVGEDLSIAFAWRSLVATSSDYVAFFHLVGPDGEEWVQRDAQPGEGNQPTSRWLVGQTVLDYWRVPVPADSIPGQWKVRLGLLSSAGGRRLDAVSPTGGPLGNEVVAGGFSVGEAAPTFKASALAARQPLQVAFSGVGGEVVRLQGVTLGSDPLRPGGELGLTLYWQAAQRLVGDYEVVLQLRGSVGETVAEWSGAPAAGTYPSGSWLAGRVFADNRRLALSTALPQGDFALLVGLRERGSGAMPRAQDGSEWVRLGQVAVRDRARSFVVPTVAQTLDFTLGGSVRLVGYDLAPTAPTVGQAVNLRLYWQCLQPMEQSYTVFTHLLDQSERVWAQEDALPGKGTLPTSGWMPGEYIADDYTLVIRDGAPAGDYVAEIGMYISESGQRLAVGDASGTPIGDRVLFGKVSVRTK